MSTQSLHTASNHVCDHTHDHSTPRLLERVRPYSPVLAIFIGLVLFVGISELVHGSFNLSESMNLFMGGFFIAFSALKFINVPRFATNFAQYDILARRFRIYGLAYPFIELGLGISYLASFAPLGTNIITIILTGIGSVGVIRSIRKKEAITCACVGPAFAMPLSKVALFEDLLMLTMAVLMIAGIGMSSSSNTPVGSAVHSTDRMDMSMPLN